ncbi:hypothetical protein OO256_26765 [Pseudomonas sp. DCB_CB]|uniref:hypothetical protein n=1 Tax=unclassified Pseudomonas TaxID=196821 RepID=UPI002249979D|nr:MULTISPECIES: hypothetical protein [unclassified Pseudomonas]MCX2694482.1 hypothetical protein [Pseudomonas sp. DCB_BZ]MCX2859688.1 hypothetical protein [Pseudomonas sp. DCB_CB]
MRSMQLSGHITEAVAAEYIAAAVANNPALEPRTVFGFDVEFVDVPCGLEAMAGERLARVVAPNRERTVVAVAIVERSDSQVSLGWIEFSHAGEHWSFDADQLARWDQAEDDFHFLAFHGLSHPTVEAMVQFVEANFR